MGRKQKLPFEHWQIIELLHITQDFYSKPENEAAFQEWKAAIVLGCAALALAGLGLVAEQRKEPQKIHKVPENTVKKAACGRKAG